LKGSTLRFDAILHWAEDPENQLPPLIVGLVDPPPSILNRSDFNSNYYIHAFTGKLGKRSKRWKPRKLMRTSEPNDAEHFKKLDEFSKEYDFVRVAFLVHKSIPKEDVRIFAHGNSNDSLMRTLELTTECGTFAIHVIYNHELKLDLDELMITSATNPGDMICGDHNFHSHLWANDATNEDSGGRELALLLENHDMESRLPKGVVTYSRGSEDSGKYLSTIDSVFAKKSLGKRILSCDIIAVPGFETDHRVIQFVLDTVPNIAELSRFNFRTVDEDMFLAKLDELVSSLPDSPLLECQVMGFAEALNKCVLDATEATVDKKTPATPVRPGPHTYAHKRASLQEAALNNSHWRGILIEYRKDLDIWVGQESSKRYRNHITTTTQKDPYAIFDHMRARDRRSKPPDRAQAPDFVITDADGNKTLVSGHEEKGALYMNVVWPDTERILEGVFARPLEVPDMPEGRDLLKKISGEIQTLRLDEVLDIINDLEYEKAPGPTRIVSDALKIGRGILNSPLERLFTACLRFSIHPGIFQAAITKAILKDGKDPSDPKSYRPVALLCSLGKILDRIMANRFKELAIANNLLPKVQFGGPGKDATQAVMQLQNWVWSGWSKTVPGHASDACHNKAHYQTSLMGLDITGAYDHVDRVKLLEILVSKGFPDWMIYMVHSFLSYRSTTVDFSGVVTKQRYWVNIGIPQGSPLSPILFLLFVAPLFDDLLDAMPKLGGKLTCFAYVDDIYLVVSTYSYQENCRILTKLHEILMNWAGGHGVHFAPSKNKLMHFHRPMTRGVLAPCTLLPDIPEMQEAKLEDVLITPDLPYKQAQRKDDGVKRKRGPRTKRGRERCQVCKKCKTTDENKDKTGKAKNKRTAETQRTGPNNVERPAWLDCQHSLRILGVFVDPQLKFREHIAHLKGRVHQQAVHLRWISGPTWGPSIQETIKTYRQKVLPMVTYACAAWFVHSRRIDKLRWKMGKILIKKLQSMQYQFLRHASGALFGTSRMLLLKELNVESLDVTLYRQALIYRSKLLCKGENSLDTEFAKDLAKTRRRTFKITRSEERNHPYAALFHNASEFMRGAKAELGQHRQRLRHTALDYWLHHLRQYAQECSDKQSKHDWDAYVAEKGDGKNVPAFNGGWGAKNLARYEGLSRAQSTMLLHCRTGAIGLRGYLNFLQVEDVVGKCSCPEDHPEENEDDSSSSPSGITNGATSTHSEYMKKTVAVLRQLLDNRKISRKGLRLKAHFVGKLIEEDEKDRQLAEDLQGSPRHAADDAASIADDAASAADHGGPALTGHDNTSSSSEVAAESLCRCGHAPETPEHLFIACKLLARARTYLVQLLGHSINYATLFTDPHQAKIAVEWAIEHFHIKQFDEVREKLLNRRCKQRDSWRPTNSHGGASQTPKTFRPRLTRQGLPRTGGGSSGGGARS
jgi:hypothetical protein